MDKNIKWHYDDYPQKPDICLVETSDSYKLLWFNQKNKWWYGCDTNEPDVDSTRNFKWVFLDDILENIE